MRNLSVFSLVLVLLFVGAAGVTSQPFSASIVIFPGCSSQFLYGQRACGELYVSDDALVTRWVEDQYGNTWYHWGTRHYTAGTHTICGYMGLPIGVHIMKIQAVRVSDSATVTAQCQYTVCCGDSVWIPERPTCNCQDVIFTADVDEAVQPGDSVTLTVTVTNNMAQDCAKLFDAGHLEVDWGILGGTTSPLVKDTGVSPGETRTIVEETRIIPPVAEGEYTVVVTYSDSECTWIDYAVIRVHLPTQGSFEILSFPDVVNVDEEGRIKLLIRNQSQKQASFTLVVKAPSEIHIPRSMYTLTIPRAGYQEINVEFQPKDTGIFTIELELESENKNMGTASISIRVEKPLSGKLEVLLSPQNVLVNKSTSATLRVTNTGNYDTLYHLSGSGNDITIADTEVVVPPSQYRDVQIFMTPSQEGLHTAVIQLEAEGQFMGSQTLSFEAEREFSFLMPALIILIVVVAAAAIYVMKKH